MSRLVLLAILLGFTESRVDFTHSVLLDQYDVFISNEETQFIPQCKGGCSVYASIPPGETEALDEARKVIISDLTTTTTLFDIANRIDPVTTQKLPLEIPAKQVALTIEYTGTKIAAGPILLYIFYNSGKSAVPFEVYEARTMKRALSSARIITILSPEPFNVGTKATELGNTVYSYAAGMENAIDNGPDKCAKVFELRDQGSFPGFILNVQMPLLSFYFNMETPVEMYTNMVYSTVTGFEQFLSSPGFIGCYGMQVYSSSLYADSVEHTVSGEKMSHLTVSATLNTGQDYPVKLTDVTNNKDYTLWGDNANHNAQQSIEMDSKLLYVSWKREYPRSAFLLRFLTDSTNSNPASITSTQVTTTTSGVKRNSASLFLLLLVSFLY